MKPRNHIPQHEDPQNDSAGEQVKVLRLLNELYAGIEEDQRQRIAANGRR